MNAGTLVKKLKLLNPELEVAFTDRDGIVYEIDEVTVDTVTDILTDEENECAILHGSVHHLAEDRHVTNVT